MLVLVEPDHSQIPFRRLPHYCLRNLPFKMHESTPGFPAVSYSSPLFGLSLSRHLKFYNEAAAVSNTTVTEHEVTFDPKASWLKFHLGINRYALYPRDDLVISQLVKEMQSLTVVSAGDGWIDEV